VIEFTAEVTRLLFASWASTVVAKAVPAVAVVGADLKTSFVAAPALTVMLVVAGVRAPLPAVRVMDPAVFRVMPKVPVPDERLAAAAGVAAAGSVEEKVMRLLEVVAVFPWASWATTIALNEVPAIAELEMDEKASLAAVPGITVICKAEESGDPEMRALKSSRPDLFPVSFAV